jgi:ABC-type metal ion transport system substrate-binding protein
LLVGLYSKKIAKIEEVHDGSTVAVANDPVNEARGLLLFEKVGLIKLREGAGEKANVQKDDGRLARFISIFRSDEVKQYIKSRYGRFFVPVW